MMNELGLKTEQDMFELVNSALHSRCDSSSKSPRYQAAAIGFPAVVESHPQYLADMYDDIFIMGNNRNASREFQELFKPYADEAKRRLSEGYVRENLKKVEEEIKAQERRDEAERLRQLNAEREAQEKREKALLIELRAQMEKEKTELERKRQELGDLVGQGRQLSEETARNLDRIKVQHQTLEALLARVAVQERVITERTQALEALRTETARETEALTPGRDGLQAQVTELRGALATLRAERDAERTGHARELDALRRQVGETTAALAGHRDAALQAQVVEQAGHIRDLRAQLDMLARMFQPQAPVGAPQAVAIPVVERGAAAAAGHDAAPPPAYHELPIDQQQPHG